MRVDVHSSFAALPRLTHAILGTNSYDEILRTVTFGQLLVTFIVVAYDHSSANCKDRVDSRMALSRWISSSV